MSEIEEIILGNDSQHVLWHLSRDNRTSPGEMFFDSKFNLHLSVKQIKLLVELQKVFLSSRLNRRTQAIGARAS